MEKHVGCNDHTGALLVSKPATDAFNAGWERVFGKKTCCVCEKKLSKEETSTYDGETYCVECLDGEWKK